MQVVHRSASSDLFCGEPPRGHRAPSAEPVFGAAPSVASFGWGRWLAGKVEEALEYRAAQIRGGLPPARRTVQPTVLEAIGRLAASTGERTLHAVGRVPPPPAEFLA